MAATGHLQEELVRDEVVLGFCRLDIEPSIHFSDLDYDTITEHGALSSASGEPLLRCPPARQILSG